MYPFPEPNDKLLTVNELINPVCVLNDIANDVEKEEKLFPTELNDDTQPIEPKPTKELVSCGVEIIFESRKDDKQPIEPRPTRDEKS